MKRRFIFEIAALTACSIALLATGIYIAWAICNMQIALYQGPDTLSYRIKYGLAGALVLICSWFLISAITAVLTRLNLRSVLIKYALPCFPFLAIAAVTTSTMATFGAEAARFPLLKELLSRPVLQPLRADLLSLAMAVGPSLLLLLAISLDFFKKSNMRLVSYLLRPAIVFSLLLFVAASAIWYKWCYSVFQRGSGDKNILFITFDAMRADHLGCYGYSRNTTPFISQLAEEGVLFTNFIAASSWSEPSYASIYSSLYPSYYSDSIVKRKSGERFLSMARILNSNNYYVEAIITNLFAYYSYGDSNVSLQPGTDTTEGLMGRALDRLSRNKDKRFFVHLLFLDPHWPYSPPDAYRQLFIDPENKLQSSEEKTKRDIALYDAEIAYLDFEISRLVEQLKSLGIYDDTYIILTSDHGESFEPELHEGKRHGFSVEGGLVRVPLFIRGPGIPWGKRIDSLASHVDLLPTFIEWAGCKPDPRCQGKSLMPLIRGTETESRTVFSELFVPAWGPRKYHFISVQKGPWKLITGGPEGNLLYNVTKDPLEKNNLTLTEPEVLAGLKSEIDGFKKNIPSTHITVKYSKEELETLKNLGYLQ